MFDPSDPRFDEMMELASRATGTGLFDRERPRWRELCGQLLGDLTAQGDSQMERRQQLRAPSNFEVHLLAPEGMPALVASSIGAGGVRLQLEESALDSEPLPVGTDVELSISIDRKRVPLLARGKVVYVLEGGEVGVSFIDLIQSDRELLEGIAVQTLLASAPAQ